MKKMIVLLAVVAFVASIATFAIAAKPTQKSFAGGKMGAVAFDHTAHEAAAGGDCAVCHHKEGEAACTTCHGVDKAAPKAKKAFHDQCKGCHKDKGAGPTKCKECHVK